MPPTLRLPRPSSPESIQVRALDSDEIYSIPSSPCATRKRKRDASPDVKSATGTLFIINSCRCEANHESYTTIIPRPRNYTVLARQVHKITRCELSSGVVTDLNGNEVLDMSDNYSEYCESGLQGLWFHPNYFAGVKLGDRRSAQVRIKAAIDLPPASSSPVCNTPESKPIKNMDSVERIPWTMRTSKNEITFSSRESTALIMLSDENLFS